MFFILLKGLGDPNHHVVLSMLERIALQLYPFRRTIEKNQWIFLEALAIHIVGVNLELARLAGGIMEKCVDDWL